MNLFTIAFAYLVSKQRGLTIGDGVDIEMLSGMASPQAHAVADTVGPLLYYVPVVRPEEYDVAVAYLVRRLEENSAPQNFMSHVFQITDDQVFSRQADGFRKAVSLAASGELSFTPNRRQDRAFPALVAEEFDNAPDTDPSLAANITWAEQILAKISDSTAGQEAVDAHVLSTAEQADDAVRRVRKASHAWASLSGAERAKTLRKVAQGFEDHRAELIEVAGSEAGKTIDQADVEVSEATDFALYYASLAEDLDRIQGAHFVSVETTLVTPPWNFPMAIPAGGVLAALAAGSGVLFKPAYLTRRTGAVIAEIMWEAGVPEDLLVLVGFDRSVSHELGEQLVRTVDQVILTGSIDTAEMFRSWRPDLRLFAETSGKNAIIVTPHADIDLAVRDVVTSAFGHAGQKCSASSLVILVGSAARSKRFRRQLEDAVKSLHVGYPSDPATQMGPVIEEPKGKLARGLTTLGQGEVWILKPQRLSDRLWSPGIRAGVLPGSEYHLTEYFGPILGVMQAETLEQAVEWQNAGEFGLTAGLHSLDPEEIDYWLDRVQAGNLYVNRTITGAIVRRQPFGGWKRSSVGTGTKAGGPNYLYGLGHLTPDFSVDVPADSALVNRILRQAQRVANADDSIDSQRVMSIVKSMDDAISDELGVEHDPSQLGVEKNIFRYRPARNIVIRGAQGRSAEELLAVTAGAVAVGARPRVSVAGDLPPQVRAFIVGSGVTVVNQSDEEFAHSLAVQHVDGESMRIRVLGKPTVDLAQAVHGSVDVAIFDEPVNAFGRVELLPFVLEQSVSATNHRFGNPTAILDGVFAD